MKMKAIRISRKMEPLLSQLIAHAQESEQANPILYDPYAVSSLLKLDYSPERVPVSQELQKRLCTCSSIIDAEVSAFIEAHSNGMVISFQTGFMDRFRRLDNGSIGWYDIETPNMLAIRSKLFPEHPRRKSLSCEESATAAWVSTIHDAAYPVLIAAQGAFMRLSVREINQLLEAIRSYWPGSSIIYDGHSPSPVRTARSGRHQTDFWNISMPILTDKSRQLFYLDNTWEIARKTRHSNGKALIRILTGKEQLPEFHTIKKYTCTAGAQEAPGKLESR